MSWIADPQIWIAFLTLAALEIVLGIDNIVFISIRVAELRAERQAAGPIEFAQILKGHMPHFVCNLPPPRKD